MRFSSFDEMLRYHCAKTPEAPAFFTEANGVKTSVSYAQFSSAVTWRCAALADAGAACEGIFCDGSYENIVEIFAAVKAGLQVALLSEQAGQEQVDYTDADLLWGDPELLDAITPAKGPQIRGGAGRLLFFTSGTTSKMKAVVLTEKSLCASAYNGGALLPLEANDTLMFMLPLEHVFGFVCGILWGLSHGAAVALGRGPRHYFDDLDFYRPTVLSAVPALLSFLLQRRLLNAELRLVLIGAGDCPEELPRTLKALKKQVSFGYGLTETSSGIALSLGDDPYAMTVCPDDEVTLGEDGEILVRAPSCMMEGYYKDPGSTAAVLHDGRLATGDIGRLDENGLLHIIGRKKEILVFSDGTKIYLPEYEKALSDVLAGRDYAVIDYAGAPVLVLRGDESERVDLTIALTGLMRDQPINRRLKDIIIITEPLPRTATGKIKRWELQQKVRQL